MSQYTYPLEAHSRAAFTIQKPTIFLSNPLYSNRCMLSILIRFRQCLIIPYLCPKVLKIVYVLMSNVLIAVICPKAWMWEKKRHGVCQQLQGVNCTEPSPISLTLKTQHKSNHSTALTFGLGAAFWLGLDTAISEVSVSGEWRPRG